jgi:hypothetical protein
MTDRDRPSTQQVLVLRGMALGWTDRRIGTDLHLSEHTIKCHARRLFQNLGATGRAHAVAIAYETGLLRLGDIPTPGRRPAPRPGVRELLGVLVAIRDSYATGRADDPAPDRSTT